MRPGSRCLLALRPDKAVSVPVLLIMPLIFSQMLALACPKLTLILRLVLKILLPALVFGLVSCALVSLSHAKRAGN